MVRTSAVVVGDFDVNFKLKCWVAVRVKNLTYGAQHRRGARRGGTSVVGVGCPGEALRGLNLGSQVSALGEPFVVEPRVAMGAVGAQHRRGARSGGTSVVGKSSKGEALRGLNLGSRE